MRWIWTSRASLSTVPRQPSACGRPRSVMPQLKLRPPCSRPPRSRPLQRPRSRATSPTKQCCSARSSRNSTFSFLLPAPRLLQQLRRLRPATRRQTASCQRMGRPQQLRWPQQGQERAVQQQRQRQRVAHQASCTMKHLKSVCSCPIRSVSYENVIKGSACKLAEHESAAVAHFECDMATPAVLGLNNTHTSL